VLDAHTPSSTPNLFADGANTVEWIVALTLLVFVIAFVVVGFMSTLGEYR